MNKGTVLFLLSLFRDEVCAELCVERVIVPTSLDFSAASRRLHLRSPTVSRCNRKLPRKSRVEPCHVSRQSAFRIGCLDLSVTIVPVVSTRLILSLAYVGFVRIVLKAARTFAKHKKRKKKQKKKNGPAEIFA